MRTWGLALALAACSFRGRAVADQSDAAPAADAAEPVDASGTPWLAGYHYRKPVTVTAGADLAGFPVSVFESADGDLAQHAVDASTFAFTANDGTTVLPSEIVAYTPAIGTLDAWVQMSVSVDPVSGFLYYGSAAAPVEGNMWAAYAGVWHMSGTTGELDSTQHHDDVSPPTGTGATPAAVLGIIGGARAYNGVHNALVTAGATPSLDFGSGSFSYEVWVDATTTAAGGTSPIWHGGSSLSAAGYDFQLGSGSWIAEIADTSGGHLGFTTIGSQATLANQWVQLVATLDRSGGHLNGYVNGAPVMTAPVSGLGSLSTTYDFEIGRNGTTTQFTGSVDEVRVISGVLPTSWITAEYANANPTTRADFIAIGAEQTGP